MGTKEDHKHKSQRSQKLIADVFAKQDFNGEGVLVVDEIVDSGRSLVEAMKLFEDVYNSKPQGIANFRALPSWYALNAVKGIDDPKLPKSIYAILEVIDNDLFNFFKSIVESKTVNEHIFKLLQDLSKVHIDEFRSRYSTLYPQLGDPIFSNKLVSFIKNLPEDVSIQNIYTYFKTYGGFLALKPSDKNLKLSFTYRQYLTKIVELSSKLIAVS